MLDHEELVRDFELAIKYGEDKKLKQLLKRNGVLEWFISTRKEGDSPLIFAAIYDRPDLLDAFAGLINRKGVPSQPIEAILNENIHLLPTAIHYGNEATFDYLLKHNVNVNQITFNFDLKKEVTPLHVAAYVGNEKMVSALINHNADLNFKDGPLAHTIEPRDGGKNLVAQQFEKLLAAIKAGDLAVVKKILPEDTFNNSYMNVLYGDVKIIRYAVAHNQAKILQYILPKYVEQKNLILPLDKKSTLKSLVNAENLYHDAIKKGAYAVVEYLEPSADVINKQDKDGQTPLHVAAMINDEKILWHIYRKAFEEKSDIDLNQKDKFGLSILDYLKFNQSDYFYDKFLNFVKERKEVRIDPMKIEDKISLAVKELDYPQLVRFMMLIPKKGILFKDPNTHNILTTADQVRNVLHKQPEAFGDLLKDDRIVELLAENRTEAVKIVTSGLKSTNLDEHNMDGIFKLLQPTLSPTEKNWNRFLNLFRKEPVSESDLVIKKFINRPCPEDASTNYWIKAQTAHLGLYEQQQNEDQAIKFYKKITDKTPLLYMKSLQSLADISVNKRDFRNAYSIVTKLINFINNPHNQRSWSSDARLVREVNEIRRNATSFQSRLNTPLLKEPTYFHLFQKLIEAEASQGYNKEYIATLEAFDVEVKDCVEKEPNNLLHAQFYARDLMQFIKIAAHTFQEKPQDKDAIEMISIKVPELETIIADEIRRFSEELKKPNIKTTEIANPLEEMHGQINYILQIYPNRSAAKTLLVKIEELQGKLKNLKQDRTTSLSDPVVAQESNIKPRIGK